MKKIKLFALAVFAMLSTDAFAAWGTEVKSTETFTYVIDGDNAQITGFVNGLTAAQMETLTIPATIVGAGDKVYNVTEIGVDGSATKFNGNTNIKKITFEASSNLTAIAKKAFYGCSSLTEIDLSNASKLASIGANALAGTSIVTLDLSKTMVSDMSAFEFCDHTMAGDADPAKAALAKNITLTTVILWDQWTKIGPYAFTNCTALKTVNFQTANSVWLHYVSTAKQEFIDTAGDGSGLYASFVGTAIEEIDLSGTILATIPEGVFNVCTTSGLVKTYSENKALKTVKLNGSLGAGKSITALNGNFSNCPNLASIDIENDAQLTTLVDKEFQFDAKLTSINLKNVTTLAKNAFEGTGLTSVSLHKTIAAIPESCFQDCAALETVTFASDYASTFVFNGIGTMAFAGDTKLTAITIPACLKDADHAIETKAFFMCTGLKSVTYKPTAAPTNTVFDKYAFKQCNDGTDANKITIYTLSGVTKCWDSEATTPAAVTAAPDCAKWSSEEAPSTINTMDWTVTKYAKADKYYVKVYVPATKGIKVKAAAGTKVYSAYIDQETTTVQESDPLTMHMCEYKVLGGYYWIKAQDAALIITNNKDLTYAESESATKTSSLTTTAPFTNQLHYLEAATSATTIAAGATDGKIIYGWVNAESVGTGWMNITSGTMPKGGLYVLAKKPAAGGRLNVVWEDADGNIVEEEATAIQTVKAAKAENGAIYNLAGQKVNAAYKGVVIKDGKKYIQK